ncbi:MAG: DUF2058 domain-containing protein [Gammaproteobacteria bacterium]|nr:DUF2058 domain-containing protein [Gammaproteobacteria bacterium]
MANSFGDQFLKAGLVSQAQLKKANKSKRKPHKKGTKKTDEVIVNEAAESARQVAAERVARDRELNQQQKDAGERKAIQAQIRQLVEMNRLPRDDGEMGYNFQDGTVIKKIFVTEAMHNNLGRGFLAIVKFNDGYEVIPSVVAEKIRLRDEFCIVSNVETQDESGEDDLYADYNVPDDLMW